MLYPRTLAVLLHRPQPSYKLADMRQRIAPALDLMLLGCTHEQTSTST
jgi:hypothetical protein